MKVITPATMLIPAVNIASTSHPKPMVSANKNTAIEIIEINLILLFPLLLFCYFKLFWILYDRNQAGTFFVIFQQLPPLLLVFCSIKGVGLVIVLVISCVIGSLLS